MNVKTKSLIANILPAFGGLFVTYLYNVVDGVSSGRESARRLWVQST